MLHNRQLTVLVYAPQSPEGKIITREPQCLRECRTPYPAFHNIIPSELCNSRRHRQCPASREEVSRGQKPAKTTCRASDYTIRIMLRTLRRQGAKVLPSNSRVRRRRTSSPPQGPPASRPVGGLRTLRILRGNVSASSGSAPPAVGIAARDFRFEARIRIKEVFVGAKCNHAYRQCCAMVRSPLEASVQCEQSSALRTSGAGSFQAVTPLPPQAPEEESRPSTPRYGFAVLIPACYSSTPLPGRIPPEVFRAGRTQPSAFAPGCWRRQCRDSATLHPPQTAPGAWCQA